MKRKYKMKNEATRKFALNLVKTMQLKGCLQKDLAHKSGLTPAYISMICGGKKEPRLSSIIKICKALKVAPHTLLGL
jgi:transcriptional regulator with XRE-family HTH domain